MPFAKDPMTPSGGPESHQLAKGSPRVSTRNRNRNDQTNEPAHKKAPLEFQQEAVARKIRRMSQLTKAPPQSFSKKP